ETLNFTDNGVKTPSAPAPGPGPQPAVVPTGFPTPANPAANPGSGGFNTTMPPRIPRLGSRAGGTDQTSAARAVQPAGRVRPAGRRLCGCSHDHYAGIHHPGPDPRRKRAPVRGESAKERTVEGCWS